MGRIFFDTDELDKLSSEVDDIKSSFDTMKTTVENFDVPSVWYDWFYYRSYLDDNYRYISDSNLYKSVMNARDDCKGVLSWIAACKTNLTTFSDDAESSFSDIEVTELKTRASIVVAK